MGGGGQLSSTVKYHYFHRFFTYSVGRRACVGCRSRGPASRCSRAKRLGVAVSCSVSWRRVVVGSAWGFPLVGLPLPPLPRLFSFRRASAFVPRAIRSEDTARRGV